MLKLVSTKQDEENCWRFYSSTANFDQFLLSYNNETGKVSLQLNFHYFNIFRWFA